MEHLLAKTAVVKQQPIRTGRLYRAHAWWGFAFALPALLLFAAFALYPIADTLRLSIYNYDLLTPKRFIGLRNFTQLLDDPLFLTSLRATFSYIGGVYLSVWTISLGLALLLNAKLRFRAIFRTIYFIPTMMSMVVVSVIWKLLWHREGLINGYIVTPLLGHPIDWLTDGRYALVAIIVMMIWKLTGFYMVIWLAGLQNIPNELYEAAAIDGADGGQRLWHITLPLLKPTMVFITVLSLIEGMQSFIPQWVMADGGPDGKTTTIALLIYKSAFLYLKMGKAAAIAVILFVFIAGITLLQWKFYGRRA